MVESGERVPGDPNEPSATRIAEATATIALGDDVGHLSLPVTEAEPILRSLVDH